MAPLMTSCSTNWKINEWRTRRRSWIKHTASLPSTPPSFYFISPSSSSFLIPSAASVIHSFVHHLFIITKFPLISSLFYHPFHPLTPSTKGMCLRSSSSSSSPSSVLTGLARCLNGVEETISLVTDNDSTSHWRPGVLLLLSSLHPLLSVLQQENFTYCHIFLCLLCHREDNTHPTLHRGSGLSNLSSSLVCIRLHLDLFWSSHQLRSIPATWRF